MRDRNRARTAVCGAVLIWATVAIAQPERDAGRDKFEKVADVLAALEVSTASRIADVGAGDGFYSVRIARAMPAEGRVTAVEVSEKALERLRQRLESQNVTNVDVSLGTFDSPKSCDCEQCDSVCPCDGSWRPFRSCW